MKKRVFAGLLCVVMLTSILAAITVSAVEGVIDRVSLSGNTTFYSSKVEGKKLNVAAYDAEGNEVSLDGKTVTYSSTRPWVFEIGADGTIIDNNYDGTTLVSATVDGVTGSTIMIKSTTNTAATRGFENDLTAGSRDVADGKAYAGYVGGGSPVEANELSRIAGEKYVGIGWHDLYYKGAWDKDEAAGGANIRVAQGWFYDDLTSVGTVMYIGLANQYVEKTGDNSYSVGGTATAVTDGTNGYIPKWAEIGFDSSIDAAVKSDDKSGYKYNGMISVKSGSDYYFYTDRGHESSVKRSKGWHQVTLIMDDNANVDQYIDGVKVNIDDKAPKATESNGEESNITTDMGFYCDDFVFAQNLNTKAPFDFLERTIDASVEGIAQVGQTLTAIPVVKDEHGPLEGESYQWQKLVGDTWTDINDATASTYKIEEDDYGSKIRVVIKPAKGDAAESEATAKVLDITDKIPVVKGLTVTGTYEGGKTIEVDYSYEDSTVGDGTDNSIIVFEVCSTADGKYTPVQSSTSRDYFISPADVGQYLRVRVIPKDSEGVVGEEVFADAVKVVGTVEFFVATTGSDENPGTIDEPFATIEKARDTIRTLADKTDGSVVVNIRGGVYNVSKTIQFGAQDSGTEDCPIIYQAYKGEHVSFVGGKELDTSEIKPVTDKTLLDRLVDQNVRNKIMQLDLGAQGVEMSPVDGNGWYDFPVDAPTEIFMNGTRLTRARWPNDDESQMLLFAKPFVPVDLTKYNSANTSIKMEYPDEEDRTNKWTIKPNDLLVGGAIAYAWACHELRIDELNAEEKWFTTSDTHVYAIDPSKVGWGPQHKIYFANIFEEIDQPGESYVDRETGMLYFYPVGKTDGVEMIVSAFEDTLLDISNASYLTFKGIDFKDNRGMLVNISNSNNVNILDGDLSGSASQAGIQVKSSKDVKIAGNHIYNIAGQAIKVDSCGNRLTCEACDVVIENNNLHTVGYNYGGESGKQAIFITDSCGVVIRNNEISDCKVLAILLQNSNDTIMEYNKFVHTMTFTTDSGVIYWGRDATSYGNIIRYNYFEDISSRFVYDYLKMGRAESVFVDDGGTGPDMYGNIFLDGGAGSSLGWTTNLGQFFNCYNNIIINASNRAKSWSCTKTWETNEEYTYKEGNKVIMADPTTSINTYTMMMDLEPFIRNRTTPTENLTASRKQLLFSDEWKERYKNTNWERATNFYSKDRYEKSLEFVANKDRTGLLKYLVESHDQGFTNKINNNVVIGATETLYYPERSEYKDNYIVEKVSEATSWFKDYDGKDFTLTDEGLAKIQTVAKEFEAIDFDEIGLYKNSSGKIPGGNRPSAEIKDELINGIAAPGNVITAAYDFIDADGDAEGNSKVYWYVADSENGEYSIIRGTASKDFAITDEHGGRYLKYEVVPYDQNTLRGEKVASGIIAVRKGGSLNTAAISAALQEAKELLEEAEVGDAVGQYPADAKPALEAAVAAASAVANNADATQYQVNKATEELENAIKLFKSKQNKVTDSYDVTYDRITLNKLLADKDNWNCFKNINEPHTSDHIEANGTTVVIKGDEKDAAFSTYTAKTFKNTEFTFNYQVDPVDKNSSSAAWGAIFLRLLENDKCCWNGNYGEMIDLKTTGTMLQEYPTVGVYDQFTDFCIEYGKKYLMTVGLYDLNDEEKLLFVITVDGETIYAKALESNQLYGLDGYIGFCAGANTQVTLSPVDVDTSALDKTIADAESLKKTVTAGTGYSQCAPELLEALDKVIADAKAAKENDEIVAEDIEEINAALQEAIKAVKDGTNSEGSLDKNGDININYDLFESEITIADDVDDVTFKVEENYETPAINVESSNMTIDIASGTVISEDFKLPLKSDKEPSGNFTLGEAVSTYAHGSNAATADKPVRIVLKGARGKNVAYKNASGAYKAVQKTINEDSLAAAEAIINSGTIAVKINVGDDLVIYTSLLTEFVTFDKVKNEEPSSEPESQDKPNFGGNGNGAGGGFFSSITTTPNADVSNTFVFSDMTSHWAKNDVMTMFRAGIVSGVTANTFEPDRSITRAEFATLITKGLKLNAEKTNDFSDVKADDWFAPFVGAAAKAGIIVGSDGKFRPNDTITREEMAVIIVKAYTMKGGKGANGAIDNFSDKAKISAWAKAYVDSAASVGLISGMGDGTFGPKANATRAQAASVIYRVIK